MIQRMKYIMLILMVFFMGSEPVNAMSFRYNFRYKQMSRWASCAGYTLCGVGVGAAIFKLLVEPPLLRRRSMWNAGVKRTGGQRMHKSLWPRR